MGRYSIKELEQLSGIKAHTIRIWEKRHRIIEPSRTQSNIRYYSDEDLKKIINVSLLNNNGVRISAIAEMTDEELGQRVIELSQRSNQAKIYIDQLLTYMIDLDEERFEAEIDMLEKKLGFESVVLDVIYPFLEKIGILWLTGNVTPAQEHFISNLIRQRIIVAIAGLPVVPKTTLRVVLFLPENELHEIALLFYHYIIRKNGFKTYYLGQSVPYADIVAVCNTYRPHLLVTCFTSNPPPHALGDYLNNLYKDFPNSRILASGGLVLKNSFPFPPNLKVFQNALELKNILQGIKSN